ncbi:MAG: class I SAM-dependent methyltransferase [Hyphomonadaceae bacterium]|nr:class I SAM-dependent methyltransferase [Hyphomonadaceae bacterium]
MNFLSRLMPRKPEPASPPAAAATVESLPHVELARENVPDAMGLTDLCKSGWFEGNELYTGFPITAEDVVVDVGCGNGGYASFAGRQGAHVVLCDIQPEHLARASKVLRETTAREVTEVLTTSEVLPLADGLATRVICTEVLEHVSDPKTMISELARITAPGGLLTLTVPHPASEELQKLVAPPEYFKPPNHVRIFSVEQFKSLVTDAGLIIERYDTFGFYSVMLLAFYWGRDTTLEQREHPLLQAWDQTWRTLFATEGGLELKRKLDTFLPGTQVIIARKPA